MNAFRERLDEFEICTSLSFAIRVRGFLSEKFPASRFYAPNIFRSNRSQMNMAEEEKYCAISGEVSCGRHFFPAKF